MQNLGSWCRQRLVPIKVVNISFERVWLILRDLEWVVLIQFIMHLKIDSSGHPSVSLFNIIPNHIWFLETIHGHVKIIYDLLQIIQESQENLWNSRFCTIFFLFKCLGNPTRSWKMHQIGATYFRIMQSDGYKVYCNAFAVYFWFFGAIKINFG